MVIWQIVANEIGPNCCGAVYCETKAEADKMLREHIQWCKEHDREPMVIAGPTKMAIKDRADMCRALNDAMGYGAC